MRLTEQEFDDIIKRGYCKIIDDSAGLSTTNSQSSVGNGSERTNAAQAFNSPVSIHFHSRRHRLTDPDGAFTKWMLDAIVEAGILRDDSAKEIQSITHSQEKIPKTEEEQTVITITSEDS